MASELPKLPFPVDALEPHMSGETLEYHWGKHHRAYVEKTNSLIQGTALEQASLEEIVRQSTGPLFNNAAQAWNHAFFWSCLTPRSRQPAGALMSAIQRRFGSWELLQDQFNQAAMAQFGSGWAWLVRCHDGSISIETTSNAETPIRTGKTPILTCDVWEHAYYIDHRNERPRFLQHIWSVFNWEFAGSNYASGRVAAA